MSTGTAGAAMDLLTITDLHKRFGTGAHAVHANNAVSLNIRAGQIVGLLGHNGAGKTTLVNQIVGLTRPTSGSIVLDGIDAVAHPAAARRVTSVQAQANVPITGLTPQRAIEIVGRIRGAGARRARIRAARLIEVLDLGRWARTPAQKVSGGIARLTAFAMCAVEPGRLVILDEPTNDVDPVRRRLLWRQIRVLADDGAAVLLVTHNVREAARAVDRLAVLDSGRVIARGAPDELVSSRAHPVVLEVLAHPGAVLEPPPWLGVDRTEGSRTVFGVPAGRETDAVAWVSRLREEGAIERYSLEPTSLEDVYVELTTHADHHHDHDQDAGNKEEQA